MLSATELSAGNKFPPQLTWVNSSRFSVGAVWRGKTGPPQDTSLCRYRLVSRSTKPEADQFMAATSRNPVQLRLHILHVDWPAGRRCSMHCQHKFLRWRQASLRNWRDLGHDLGNGIRTLSPLLEAKRRRGRFAKQSFLARLVTALVKTRIGVEPKLWSTPKTPRPGRSSPDPVPERS
jgi:hypothetical protein